VTRVRLQVRSSANLLNGLNSCDDCSVGDLLSVFRHLILSHCVEKRSLLLVRQVFIAGWNHLAAGTLLTFGHFINQTLFFALTKLSKTYAAPWCRLPVFSRNGSLAYLNTAFY